MKRLPHVQVHIIFCITRKSEGVFYDTMIQKRRVQKASVGTISGIPPENRVIFSGGNTLQIQLRAILHPLEIFHSYIQLSYTILEISEISDIAWPLSFRFSVIIQSTYADVPSSTIAISFST